MNVELTLTGTRGQETVAMPVWTPGSYLVREFARHIQNLEVTNADGKTLPHWKTDKNHWAIPTGRNRQVIIRYQVYAFEHSVRTSYVDADHALLNGASIFLYWQGHADIPHEVEIELPATWSTISTSLEPFSKPGNTHFSAQSYDELVDSPLELGNHAVLPFMVDGKPHEIALYGNGNFDDSTLVADFSRIVAEEIRLFGSAPYSHYLFIVHASEGRGGLEHMNSSVNFVDRWAFGDSASYHSVLSLISHEFFHTWNVKRIRPAGLDRFDYDRENYTSELWIAEGITSYYDELLLLRAGLMGQEDYLDVLAGEINRLEGRPGRELQSAAESSFDAWIKYYRSDEHSSNNSISYYNKGHLLGVLLDLEIRSATVGKKSLDDVFRLLMERYGDGRHGFSNEDFRKLCEQVSGRSFKNWFTRYVTGKDPLPYAATLGLAGFGLDTTRSGKSWIGARLQEDGGRLKINRILANSPAWNAGLNVGDEIIALDGFRVHGSELALLQERKPGDLLTITLSRNGILRELVVPVAEEQARIGSLRGIAEPTSEQLRIRESWIGVSGE